MKIMVVACLLAASVFMTPSAVGSSGLSYVPRTILCHTFGISFAIVTAQGGDIDVHSGDHIFVDATPQGAVVDARLTGTGASARWVAAHFCTRLRVRKQPKAVIPHPSYSGEGGYECDASGTVVINMHYLRTGRRINGIYVSVRDRRTGKPIIAGVLTAIGTTRYYLNQTCVAR